jgi:hypothetical protein
MDPPRIITFSAQPGGFDARFMAIGKVFRCMEEEQEEYKNDELINVFDLII